MHRATPSNTSTRAYSAGGARSVIDSVDDKKLMQESSGNISKGENRSRVEAPQNYGYSSVTADSDKGEQGGGGESGPGSSGGESGASGGGMGAEAFISFMGGNRSFPVASVIDDRRHRLKGLEKGDVAMFGQREWGQQFHLNKDGMWMSGNKDKRIKMQLVENEQEGLGAGGAGAGGAGGGAGGAGAGGGQQQEQKAKGQKHLYDKTSDKYVDIAKEQVQLKYEKAHGEYTAKYSMGYFEDKANSYRTDKGHTHIKHGGASLWTHKGGCYSSSPIQIKKCTDES